MTFATIRTMISRLKGELLSVANGRAEIAVGPVTIEAMLSGAAGEALEDQIGRTITLFTQVHLEAQGQGSSFTPRMLGFLSEQERAFFQLFTTVKGLGPRKALRALQLPFEDVAFAIASKDVALLKTLPEIGKRTAETIVAELHGKVDRFVEVKPIAGSDTSRETSAAGTRRALIQDAVMVLTQLGEPALHARQLAERAITADPELTTADALVAAAFRLKDAG